MIYSLLVLKLGLVRFATSLLVVLLANVLNRILIVELSVPATLVSFSFAFQHVMTPMGLVLGYCSDYYPLAGRYRTPYILGGMCLSILVMPFFPEWALALGESPTNRTLLYIGVLLFSLFGIGTTVSATTINALLVDRVSETQRGSALTLIWILTLAGIIGGSFLTQIIFPVFSPQELRKVFGLISLLVMIISIWGVIGVEPRQEMIRSDEEGKLGLWSTLKFLGSNGQSRYFFAFVGSTVFFLAIQTFILTPYGGEVLSLSLAQTHKFGIYTTYGVLLGMIVVHLVWSLRQNMSAKAILSVSLVLGGLAFSLLSLSSFHTDQTLGIYSLCLLGFSRGLYNVGLSHLTMSMAHPAFSGTFMGLWNLTSGLALAAGEMVGGGLKDILEYWLGSINFAYGWVFLIEGMGLICCAALLVPLKRDQYYLQCAKVLTKECRP
jgi:BCD family chlorophyll transporter-like MFS transporter